MADGEDFVAAFESGTFRRSADAGNNQAAFACTFIDAQGQTCIIDGKAVRRICLLRLLGSARRRFVLLSHAAEFDFHINLLAFSPYFQRNLLTRQHRADHDRQIAGHAHFFAVDAADDVAHLQSCLHCGAVRHHFGNQRAAGFVQAERFRQIVRYFLNNHTQLTALNLTAGFQLLGNIHRHINRNREGNAHKSAASAVNLGVDADYLTFQVKQRAAGVTRIDGNVGLDERRVAFVRQAASFGGHDARSNAVVKAERRADSGNPLARFQIFRITDFDDGQLFRSINLQQRNIRLRI